MPSAALESRDVTGELVQIDAEVFYRISNHDAMPPFLMSVVSSADHWLFLSSNGALTAGRRTPDDALFPYGTDDRVHDGQDITGGMTILRVPGDAGTVVWEPFSGRHAGPDRGHREVAKSVSGTRVIFTETRHDLGLAFSQEWTTSDRYGFVRRCTLRNLTDAPISVDVLDGIRNVLPPGVDELGQLRFSTLIDGLKINELDEDSGLGVFRLSALRSDSAEPGESLRATTVFGVGLQARARLLSIAQLDRFRETGTVVTEAGSRGRRGAYLISARCVLGGDGARSWLTVADLGRDAADIVALRARLRTGADLTDELAADVITDVAASAGRVDEIVAAADGVQCTGDELTSRRHFANTLFNLLRGGLPADGYEIRRDDLLRHVAAVSVSAYDRHRALLEALPATLPRQALVDVAAAGDPVLERIVRQYLPLRYSRRHGDPSRPWNTFTIALRDAAGHDIVGYEGNWRDVFQNWEALAYSFPGFLESMIFTFVDSSTADGHNPFHLSSDGFDWERLEPGESTLHLGYWGDHQVVYLLRLLEASARFTPGALGALLHRRLFTYADVPYRIRPYADLLADPHRTIDFDAAHDAELARRRAARGADGVLLTGADGEPLRVTLAEKLLVVALTKLTHYVPGAGIWLNTQRPEWNDGNNALVGYGVSVVTLCHLRRYLALCQELFAGPQDVELSDGVACLLRRVAAELVGHDPAPADDVARRTLLDALGTAGGDYRAAVYADGPGQGRAAVPTAEVRSFCEVALTHVDATILANRRPDGLYHSYNLMRVSGDAVTVRTLYPMLEGQVAALSSGLLPLAECVSVLDALRASALYRADQHSYLLYPDRELPPLLSRGLLPPAEVDRSALLTALVAAGDRSVVVRDSEGAVRFHADFRNAADVRVALDALTAPELRPLADADTDAVLELYEQAFDHRSYTGRSGTLFKYEGLGCIYWHMVSKLRLAVHELLSRHGGADPALLSRLREHYEQIRAGIGVHKSPRVHGAVPIDPYSHTPGFAGAQQPGMTGQVKEDILARLGELGVEITGGRVVFRRDLLRAQELLSAPGRWRHLDLRGRFIELDLPAGTLGLTLAQVPIVVHADGPPRIEVTDGADRRTLAGLVLDEPASAHIFGRTGRIRRLDVHLGLP
jgi:hypothetical protein